MQGGDLPGGCSNRSGKKKCGPGGRGQRRFLSVAGRVVRVYELMHVTCCRVGSTQLSAVILWLT